MKICFVTGNEGKFLEVKEVMDPYGIEVEHVHIDKPEMKSDSIEEIARDAAERLANKLNRTVVVEDTGFFLKAYKNFPGAHPHFIYDSIGLEGIFKLLEGKARGAYFMTVAAYCEPGKKAESFEGVVNGRVADNISKETTLPQLPYDKVFIPEGHDKPWAEIMEVKKSDSHRVRAFKKVAEYLKEKSE